MTLCFFKKENPSRNFRMDNIKTGVVSKAPDTRIKLQKQETISKKADNIDEKEDENKLKLALSCLGTIGSISVGSGIVYTVLKGKNKTPLSAESLEKILDIGNPESLVRFYNFGGDILRSENMKITYNLDSEVLKYCDKLFSGYATRLQKDEAITKEVKIFFADGKPTKQKEIRTN